MLNLLLSLIFFIYNEKLWINYLAFDTVLTITGDEKIVYVGVNNGILLFDAQKIEYLKTLTKLDGILENLKFVAFDRELNSLWLVDSFSNLMRYSPFTKKKEIFKLNITPKAIGVGKQFLYFIAQSDTYQWDKRKKRLLRIERIVDTAVFWYGEKKKYSQKDFIFLAPYYQMDENLNKYFYKEVFIAKRNLWVSANGYGILVYDLFTKNLIKTFPFNSTLGKIKKILKFGENIWLISDNYLVKTDYKIWKWQFFTIFPYIKLYSEKETLLKYDFLELFYKKPVSIFANSKNSFAYVFENNIYLFLPEYSKPIEIQTPGWIENIYFLNDTVVILTEEGFYLFDYKSNIFLNSLTYLSETKFGVFSFLSLKDAWYLGVRGGFLVHKKNKWKKVIIPKSNLFEPIKELTNFNKYLITKMDNQIVLFDTEKEMFQFLTKEDGLIGENIYCLMTDNNKLWIASEKGISLFDLTFLTKRNKR